jgi:hypothetical protein
MPQVNIGTTAGRGDDERMQLAYVFAHAPGAATGRDEYVAGLQQFHDALAAAPPDGFVDSWVWHVPDAAPVGSFEDWYLVEDWTAVGVLNAAAVTGARKAAHDAVARLAGTGAGGIYALAYGHPACDAGYRLRIDKPAGVPYSSFEADLLDVVGSWATVWKRQMVLGPDREYLVDAPSRPHRTLLGQPLTVAELRPVRSARTT